LFFLQEDAKKHEVLEATKPQPIQNAAVIGAGTMGSGIATLMAQKGIWTRLKDVKPEFLANGLATARKLVRHDLQRQRITPLQARDVLDHLRPTTDNSGLRHAELVIEAIIEDLPTKQQVFRELAEATSPTTVLATNTSSLLVRDIAAEVPHPERVVGLHFFNPPHQMPLVEVVRTEQTSPAALATAFALTQRLGKTAVVVRDCPGFLVNRLLAPYMNEAGWLLLEVSDPLEIDRAAVLFGLPMGPLELTDLVGLPVAQHVAENMHAAYGERMTPAPLWAALRELAATNSHAAKSLLVGKGRRKKLNPVVRKAVAQVRQSGMFSTSGGTPQNLELTQRLIFPIINEAARCLEEGVVATADEIDLAMVFGTGFAPFRGGPMRYAASIGYGAVVEALEKLAADKPRLAPSDALRKLAAK
jgi:3-hydroxyacyl-CoA dehydrogenase